MRKVGGDKRDVREDTIFWGKIEMGDKDRRGKGRDERRKGGQGSEQEERQGEKKAKKMKGETVAGSDAGVWRRGREGEEAPSPAPSGVIGSWTANLSQLNQQQQR